VQAGVDIAAKVDLNNLALLFLSNFYTTDILGLLAISLLFGVITRELGST